MFKRIACTLLALLTVVLLLPVGTISVSAATELEVNWNSGYVGHSTNQNYKNKLSGSSANWRYTDIITVEKAGTRISFSLDGSYPSNAVWVFSTWKQSGTSWVLDLDGANVEGTASYEYIGQTKSASGGMDYEFITDRDNQSIRICIGYSDSLGLPKIYSEPTTAASTLSQLSALDFTATLNDNGTIDGLRWFCGYASSATNTNGSAREVKVYSAATSNSYAFSNLVLIPRAGTRITYTIASSPNSNYNSFTRYKLVGSHYEYDDGFNASDTQTTSGTTFTYITSEDNEVLRFCCRPNVHYSTVYIDAPVTVKWSLTGEAGSLASRGEQKTDWPAAEPRSLVTGAPLVGTVIDVKWNNGYVGSQYHDSAKFALASPSSRVYFYTDVFTVPKAGTTVLFFDQTYTDFDGGTYATTSAMTVSHWKQKGSAWVFDKDREYLTGCDVYNIKLTDEYRYYAYTTTEDNENIRLCMRYGAPYAAEDPIIPEVYLIEANELAVLTASTDGKLTAQSYTDAAGSNVSYSVYLPQDYSADRQYTLVFDASDSGSVAQSLADRGYTGIVVACSGETTERALRLLDEVCEHYPVKVSDILLVGDGELAAHAAKFENIRLCQSMLLTSGSAPKVSYTEIKTLDSFASVDEAANWLVGQTESYYSLLEGLTMYAIGDSYFGGSQLGQHQTWVNLLGYKYGMTFHNYGIGGNTLAAASGIGSNQPPMYTRYTEMPDGGDIYIIEGGRNDRHYSVPFGKNTDQKGTTIKGAINIMIAGVRKNNPDALIVLVTPWSHKKESGYLGTNNDYADAIRELAEYYNDPHIVCLYAADTEFTGINMSDANCRKQYCITASDVSHLNANGMYMVEPIFEKWIAEKYAALKSLSVEDSAQDDKFIAPVTEPVTDPDTDTTTPAPSIDTAPIGDGTTTAPDDSRGGCGSVILPGLMICLLPAAIVILRKKD